MLHQAVYTRPGRYVERVRGAALARPRAAAVTVSLVNEHGQHFADVFTVAYNVHFYKLIKWLLALPLAAMAAVLAFVTTPVVGK